MSISITEKEFKQWYPKHDYVWELLNTQPQTEGELITKYLPSKLWRLNNLYSIIDKYGEPCIFKMNRAQFYVYSHLFIHPRLITLKSRQQGISTLFLVSYSDDGIFYSNFNCGLMAQDKEAAATLLERTKYLWDTFDLCVKDFLSRKLTKDNTSELGFNNNSSLFIRTSFRSATLHRLHISELGKIANKFPDRAKETKTGTLQALAPGNIGVVESTAEGANMFKTMWDQAVAHSSKTNLAAKDFLPVFLPWLDDPDCVEFEPQEVHQSAKDYFTKLEQETGRILTQPQKNFWIMQERELEGDIHQEYPATPAEAFAAAKDGTYWARKYLELIIRRRRKIANLYDPNLDVFCVMDLGRNDYMVLTFFQVYKNSIRIIGEYHNSGEGLKHYADKLIKHFRGKLGWDIDEIGLPHDAMVVDLSEEHGRNRQEILRDYGVTNTIVLDKQGVATGVELVREAMPYIWIDETCTYLDQCFMSYSKKWNDQLRVWNSEPMRNEYAHGADTIRYMIQYVHRHLKFNFTSAQEHKNNNNGRNKSQADGIAL